MKEAPHHDSINPLEIDREGGHYVYWVERLTADKLHSKADIAQVLGWYRREIALLNDNLKKLILEGNCLVRASRHYMEVTDTMLEHSENGDIPQDVMESVSEAHGSLNRCIHYWNKRVMKILQENQEVTNQ